MLFSYLGEGLTSILPTVNLKFKDVVIVFHIYHHLSLVTVSHIYWVYMYVDMKYISERSSCFA